MLAVPTELWVRIELDLDALTCDTLNHMGRPSTAQYAYVVVAADDPVFAVQIGIDYDHGVDVGGWHACINAIEMPTSAWPEPRSGIGMIWGHCLPPSGPDHLVVIGCLEIVKGSWGRIWITEYKKGQETYVEVCPDPDRQTKFAIEAHMRGMARVHGVHPGRPICASRADDADDPARADDADDPSRADDADDPARVAAEGIPADDDE